MRPPAPAQAPAARAAAPPAPRPGPRPIIKTGAGFFTKAFIWLLLLSLGAIVGGAYYFKGEDGKPLAETFIRLAKVTLHLEPPPPPPPPPPKLEDDAAFKDIVAARKEARIFLDGAANPLGDLTPAVAGDLEKRLKILGDNLGTLGNLSGKYPAPGAAEEISLHAKLQQEVASTLATVQVALEKISLAKAAEAAKAALPAVVEVELAKLNPWAGRPAGTWVRWKRTADGRTTYEDEILHSVGAAPAVLSVIGFGGETPHRLPDRELALVAGKGKVVREEALRIGDQEVPCRVVDAQGATFWVPTRGRLADRAIVKLSSGDQELSLSSLSEEEISVKGEARKCVRFERNGTTSWGHEDVPGFLVRVQTDGLLSEVVDWGTDARPEFPHAPKAPVASAETVEAFRRVHPWSASKPGHWTRRKAEYVSPLASAETVSDFTVVEVSDDHLVLKTETLGLDGQVKMLEARSEYAPSGAAVSGEEVLQIGGTPRACIILESPSEMGSLKTWILKEGVPAILKIESPTSSRTATAVAEETLRIGRHEVKCLHVTSEGRRDDLPIREDVWWSTEVPGLEVRRETVQQTSVGAARSTTTLLDFGDIPARKTAIGFQKEDPARLEEQRVLKVIDDAEVLVIGASTTFRELLGTAKEPPAQAAAAAELVRRCDEVGAQLGKAKDLYASVRDRAPQAAGLDEKISKIDKALAALQKIREPLSQRAKN
jgi:hypothetical protein